MYSCRGNSAIFAERRATEYWTLDQQGNWETMVQKTDGTTDLDQDRLDNDVNETCDERGCPLGSLRRLEPAGGGHDEVTESTLYTMEYCSRHGFRVRNLQHGGVNSVNLRRHRLPAQSYGMEDHACYKVGLRASSATQVETPFVSASAQISDAGSETSSAMSAQSPLAGS